MNYLHIDEIRKFAAGKSKPALIIQESRAYAPLADVAIYLTAGQGQEMFYITCDGQIHFAPGVKMVDVVECLRQAVATDKSPDTSMVDAMASALKHGSKCLATYIDTPPESAYPGDQHCHAKSVVPTGDYVPTYSELHEVAMFGDLHPRYAVYVSRGYIVEVVETGAWGEAKKVATPMYALVRPNPSPER